MPRPKKPDPDAPPLDPIEAMMLEQKKKKEAAEAKKNEEPMARNFNTIAHMNFDNVAFILGLRPSSNIATPRPGAPPAGERKKAGAKGCKNRACKAREGMLDVHFATIERLGKATRHTAEAIAKAKEEAEEADEELKMSKMELAHVVAQLEEATVEFADLEKRVEFLSSETHVLASRQQAAELERQRLSALVQELKMRQMGMAVQKWEGDGMVVQWGPMPVRPAPPKTAPSWCAGESVLTLRPSSLPDLTARARQLDVTTAMTSTAAPSTSLFLRRLSYHPSMSSNGKSASSSWGGRMMSGGGITICRPVTPSTPNLRALVRTSPLKMSRSARLAGPGSPGSSVAEVMRLEEDR